MSRRAKPSKQVICKNDEEINPKTGRCRKKCKDDEERNEETGRCRKKSGVAKKAVKKSSKKASVGKKKSSKKARIGKKSGKKQASPSASPQRVSQQVSPKRVYPQPKQSEFYSVEDVIFYKDYRLYDTIENMLNNVLQVTLYIDQLSVEELTWKVSAFLEDLIEKIFTLQEVLPIVPNDVYKCLEYVPLGIVEYNDCIQSDKKMAYIVKDVGKKLKNLPYDRSTPKRGCFHIPNNIFLSIMLEKTSEHFGKTYEPSSFLRMFSRQSFVIIHTALDHFLTRLINSSFSSTMNSSVFDGAGRISRTSNALLSNRQVNIIPNTQVPFNNVIDKVNKMLDNKDIENSFYQQWNFMLNILSKHLIQSALQLETNNKIDINAMRKVTKLILQDRFYDNITDNETNNLVISKLLPLPKLEYIELLSNEAKTFLNLTLEYLTVEALSSSSLSEEEVLSNVSLCELSKSDYAFSKLMDNLKVYFV